MNLIRNKQQTVLHDLLVATRKSVDHYRDAADFLGALRAGNELRSIANERDRLVEGLEQAVKESGDLPSVPDEDRESVEKLFHRVHASLSSDEVQDVLQQRLDAEQAFARELAAIHDTGSVGKDAGLLAAMEEHVQFVIKRLNELLQALAR